MARTLTYGQARRVYDRIGRFQDRQAFYEDRAVHEMIALAGFERARSLFELGCGTGRHAARLLAEHLPGDATYLGVDISPNMVSLARARLGAFAGRARVELADGAPVVPAPDQSFDRFMATYVLDLLSEDDIRAVLREAHRVLADDGRLCLVGITPGRTGAQRAAMGLVSRLHALQPALVGGCRPIDLAPFVDDHLWRTEALRVVSAFGVGSQVVIAARRPKGAP